MFLAIDIGNSTIKLGLFDKADWTNVEQCSHKDIAETLSTTLSNQSISAVGIASVVPETLTKVREQLEAYTEPFIVGPNVKLPFEMAYETPQTLGADRIAAAAGAFARWKNNQPIIVIDAGTAVTLEVISSDGTYLGGSIAPGPDLLQFGLSRGTAQLPEVDWALPPSVIGSSTTTAIQSGLVFPFLEGIKSLIHSTVAELEGSPIVVATGGWAPWLATHIPVIQHVEPNLVLDGIRTLALSQ